MDDGGITLASVLFICVFDRMGSFQIYSLNSNWRTNSCLCPLLRHLCSGSDIFHRLVGRLWADRSICESFIQWLVETWLFSPSFPSAPSLDDWNLLGIARSMAFGGLTHVSSPYNVIHPVQVCVTSHISSFLYILEKTDPVMISSVNGCWRHEFFLNSLRCHWGNGYF